MDYFAEMEGLNKPRDSPLKEDYTKVMNKPITKNQTKKKMNCIYWLSVGMPRHAVLCHAMLCVIVSSL